MKLSTFVSPSAQPKEAPQASLKRPSTHLTSIGSIGSVSSTEQDDGGEIIEAGKGIGHSALTEPFDQIDLMRCLQECHIASILKVDFDQIFKRIEEKAREEAIAFLKKMPYFQHWSKAMLNKVVGCFKPLQCKKD